MMVDKKSKVIDVEAEVISGGSNSLLPTNPLLQGQMITPGQETEQKVAMIAEIESLAEINKQQLSVRRERVALELDNKKLDVAKTIMDGIEIIADEIVKPETIKKIMGKKDLSPMDLKFLAESMDRMATVLKNMMNPNVADEFGNKKKTKINFMFKSTGVVQGAIQVDNSGD
jgi:hypothetical protein